MVRAKKLVRHVLQICAVLASVLVLAYALFASRLLPCIPTERITVGTTKLWVCIADSRTTQTMGLSNSRYLPRGWGMLFVFSDYRHHMFWMKDMNYPIDILWLDDKLNPVEVARGAQPESYPGLFSPLYANRFVLETRTGVIDGHFPRVKVVNN